MEDEALDVRVLCRTEDGGEMRRVDLLLSDELAIVRERTSGPMTMAVFGTHAHAHEVRLHAVEADAAADAAGCEYVEDLVEGFFGGGEATLLDFEDWMSERNLDFGYVSRMGDVIAFRPASA